MFMVFNRIEVNRNEVGYGFFLRGSKRQRLIFLILILPTLIKTASPKKEIEDFTIC